MTSRTTVRRLPFALAALGAAISAASLGCSGGSGGTPPPSSARNVLEQVVAFTAPAPGSVKITSSASGDRVETPWLPVAEGPGSVTVVGLLPLTDYVHTVAFTSSLDGSTRILGNLAARTRALPADLPDFRFAITPVTSAPPAGYYLVSGAGEYQLAFDAEGTLRWYERFEPATAECKMQYDGSFTAFVGSTQGFQPVEGEYVRFRADGAIVASYTTAPDPTEPGSPPVFTDNHELLVTRDAQGQEHLHLFGYELRPASPGGPLAAWHEILREAPDGTVEFRWKTWNVFSAADTTETVPGGADVDHANSLEIAPDGNYVASFRDLDEITKIDAQTGAVIWRFGGKHDQFTILNDPLGGFSGQHSVRVLPDGNLLVYDDGLRHSPPESRAVEYALDTTAMTATLVWEFRHRPALFTPYVGSVERLANGNTLVAFALLGTVCEVDPSGALVWEGAVTSAPNTPTFAYRIRRLPSLYELETP